MLLVAAVAAAIAMRRVEERTVAAMHEQRSSLADLRRVATARAPIVLYRIYTGQAALEAATGEPGRALVRYERAFALGVGRGQRSLTSYLGLSVAHEGSPAARERLARLERRFAGHPAPAAARQGLDRGR